MTDIQTELSWLHTVDKLPESARTLYYAVTALAVQRSPLDVLRSYSSGVYAAQPADIRAVHAVISAFDQPRWQHEHGMHTLCNPQECWVAGENAQSWCCPHCTSRTCDGCINEEEPQ